MKRNFSKRNPTAKRRPFWGKLPRLHLGRKLKNARLPKLPRLHLGRKLKNARLPSPPQLRFPRYRISLPPLRIPSLNLYKLRNPFQKLSLGTVDKEGLVILLNWLGYILVMISAVDYFFILYPPQLTNTTWEFQAVAQMISNAWFMILGLILIYLPNRVQIRGIEIFFLKGLRWLILTAGIIFILLLPLTIVNANRLYQDAVEQIDQQQVAQQEQLDEINTALEAGNLPYFQQQRLRNQWNIETIPPSSSLEVVLIETLQQRKEELKEQAQSQKENRFRQFFRQGGRNSLAGLLIGAFLIRLWWMSRWLKHL